MNNKFTSFVTILADKNYTSVNLFEQADFRPVKKFFCHCSFFYEDYRWYNNNRVSLSFF